MNTNWIPCSDRLPEEKDSGPCNIFLVVTRTHGGILPEGYYQHVTIATFMSANKADEHWPGNTGYWEFDGNEQSIPFEVTHWMPMPEEPK